MRSMSLSRCTALLCTLISFYFSHLAMREAQRQFIRGERDEKKLGGVWGTCTVWLNPISGSLFIVGLIAMSLFVAFNLSHGPHRTGDGSTNAQGHASAALNATGTPRSMPTVVAPVLSNGVPVIPTDASQHTP